ncbi:MAG: serine/threonine protein kinase [Chloroflexi bacterium]|nr:serine/threonine protein kinase [Chloroflexota bacterium]
MSDLIGKKFGQYEVLKQIGKGGMATVYLGQQKSIGRMVAIKVLPAHLSHDDTFIKRFEREVQTIALLQHPRIMPVYDYGQQGGSPYIVMAYLNGGTLSDLVKEQGTLPLDRVARITEQIAEGLDFAHDQGVIHRDFKPSNVLLDANGNAYLADFGIAKISMDTGGLTGSGIVGTPTYMAPEMFKQEPITPAVDVYALGVTVFQMFSGEPPFGGTTPVHLMYAHLNEPVPTLSARRHDLPEALQAILDRAMAKRPEQRYPSAQKLAADLKAIAEGRLDNLSATAVADSPDVTPKLVDVPELPGVKAAPQPELPVVTQPTIPATWWGRNWRVVLAGFVGLMIFLGSPILLAPAVLAALVLVGVHLQNREWPLVGLWMSIPICGLAASSLTASGTGGFAPAVVALIFVLIGLGAEIAVARRLTTLYHERLGDGSASPDEGAPDELADDEAKTGTGAPAGDVTGPTKAIDEAS